jgi:hypothetical protein
MSVKAVKLVSGEELIGEVEGEEPGLAITLKKVVVVAMRTTQTGDLNIGFIPFAPYTGMDSSFTFELRNTIFVKDVDDKMKNQYNSLFGGIVTPPKTLLIG